MHHYIFHGKKRYKSHIMKYHKVLMAIGIDAFFSNNRNAVILPITNSEKLVLSMIVNFPIQYYFFLHNGKIFLRNIYCFERDIKNFTKRIRVHFF